MFDETTRQRVLSAAEGLEDISERRMFGCWCLFAAGRIVVIVHGQDIVCRLSERSRLIALKLEGACLFTPRPNLQAKELVKLPPHAVSTLSLLSRWLREAHAFALEMPKASQIRPSPPRKKSVPERSRRSCR